MKLLKAGLTSLLIGTAALTAIPAKAQYAPTASDDFRTMYARLMQREGYGAFASQVSDSVYGVGRGACEAFDSGLTLREFFGIFQEGEQGLSPAAADYYRKSIVSATFSGIVNFCPHHRPLVDAL